MGLRIIANPIAQLDTWKSVLDPSAILRVARRNAELKIYHCRIDGASMVLAIQNGIDYAQLNNLFAANPLEGRDTTTTSETSIPIPLAILARARPDLILQKDLEEVQGRLDGDVEGLRSGESDIEVALEPRTGGSFIDLT